MSNVITAYIKLPSPVTSHEQVEGATGDPARVVGFTSEGAWTAEPVEGEQFVVYDLHTQIPVEVEEFISNGYQPLTTEDGETWVESFTRETRTEYETKVETFAVAVEVGANE